MRPAAALLLLLWGCAAPPPPGPKLVRTADELVQAVGAAAPGDVIALADGRYKDFQATIYGKGESGRPIVLQAQTTKGVTFTGASSLRLQGDFLLASGFRFEGTGLGGAKWVPNVEILGAENRVTGCDFIDAAGGTAVYTGIVLVARTADGAEVDHLTFRGSRTISVKVALTATELPDRVRIHDNLFEDISIAGGNGGEAIQLGSGGRATDVQKLGARVERNVMRRVRADPELISNKSSCNIIRFNRLYDSEGEIVLRGGNSCVVEGNLLVRTDGGIRVCGSGHRIVNNVVLDAKSGLFLTYGGTYYDPARGNTIAHNTFHSRSWTVTFAVPNPSAEEKSDPKLFGAVEGNTIVNNVFLTDSSKPFLRHLEGVGTLQALVSVNRISNNLFWRKPAGSPPVPELAGNLFADPKLVAAGDEAPRLGGGSPALGAGLDGFAEQDFHGKSRGGKPDLGAIEEP